MVARPRAAASPARTRRVPAAVTIGLVLAACTSPGTDLGDVPTDTDPSPVSSTTSTAPGGGSGDAGETSAPGSTAAAASIASREPARWSRITSSSTLASAGRPVVLETLPEVRGDIVLTGPDDFEIAAAMVDGRAEVVIPDGAPTGDYLAVVGAADGQMAVGTVTVVSAPTLRLSADRTHVAPGETVTVRLDAADVPDDLLVMLGWGDVDWRAYALDDDDDDGQDIGPDDEADEGEPLGILVPDQSDLLQPGSDARPVGEVAGRALRMVGMEIASLQALAFTPDGDEIIFSDPLVIDECATPVELRGTIGGPGTIRVVAFGDGLRSTGQRAAGGTFGVDSPHGPLAVFAARDDGTELEPVVVDVPCGGSADVDLTSAQALVTAPEPVDPFDTEFVEGESGSLELTGAIAAEFAVEPVCTSDGTSVEVIFGVYDIDLPALLLTVDDGSRAGTATGTIELTDWSAGAVRSAGPVDVTIAYSGSVIAEGAFSIAGDYDGAAGSGTVAGEFTCAVLGLVPPPPSADDRGDVDEPPPDDPGDVPPVLTTFDTPDASGGTATRACSSVLVRDAADPGAGLRLAAGLRASLPRAAVTTTSELDHLVRDVGPQRAATVTAAITAAEPPDVLVDIGRDSPEVTVSSLGSSPETAWSATVPVEEVAALVAARVLCVDAPPAFAVPGETVSLPITVTTLAGDPVEVVPVRVTAPDGSTTGATTSAGRAEVSFEVGAAGTTTFDVEAGSPEIGLGNASARVEVGSAYVLVGQWFIDGDTADPDSWIPPGRSSITLAAKTCAGIEGPWKGIWIVESVPFLSALQTMAGINVTFGFAIMPQPDFTMGWVQAAAAITAAMSLPAVWSLSVDPEEEITAPASLRVPAGDGPVRVWIGGSRATEMSAWHVSSARAVSVAVDQTHLFTAGIRPTEPCSQDELVELHKSHLEAFREWIKEMGWKIPPPSEDSVTEGPPWLD